MARGKSKVNAREARREQALQSIVDSMIGPYGDFVREQLQDVSQRLRAARAAQSAPPPGAGAPGALPMTGAQMQPSPVPPMPPMPNIQPPMPPIFDAGFPPQVPTPPFNPMAGMSPPSPTTPFPQDILDLLARNRMGGF